jgi:hypothetical protein
VKGSTTNDLTENPTSVRNKPSSHVARFQVHDYIIINSMSTLMRVNLSFLVYFITLTTIYLIHDKKRFKFKRIAAVAFYLFKTYLLQSSLVSCVLFFVPPN